MFILVFLLKSNTNRSINLVNKSLGSIDSWEIKPLMINSDFYGLYITLNQTLPLF